MWQKTFLTFATCFATTAVLADKTRLTVEEPTGVDRRQWPVTSGIPLAQGALRDDQTAALYDAGGKEIPLQTESLARWPDGSIRWLLLDFQIDLAAKQKKTLTLRFGREIRRAPVPNPVRIAKGVGEEGEKRIVIDTGTLRLEYYPKWFSVQARARRTAPDGARKEQIAARYGRDDGAILDVDSTPQDPGGPREVNRFCGETADMEIEQSGPVRGCIRASGWHEDDLAGGAKKMFRYVARIHAWRGQPYVRIFYTFINDHQASLMTKIMALELVFRSYYRGPSDTASTSCLMNGQPVERGELFQIDESHRLLDGKPAGGRGLGWAAVGEEHAGLAIGLREFWQNWPKAIRCESRLIVLGLCPTLYDEYSRYYEGKPLEEENKLYYAVRDGQYTFKVGVAKTHEFWINYFTGKPDAKRLGTFFQAAEEPLLAVADPAYVSATKALGEVPPADRQKFDGYDAWVDRALEAHLKRREKVREYGLLNYGDWYGERKVNWGNLEYDLAHGMFLQYLRTGDRRYFLRGEQAARHHIDVDVVHATNPYLKNPWGPPPQVGDIWLHCLNHTGGYYENAPLPVSRTYQMGHSTNFGHVWVGGDFEYYYLTGDRRAREVAIEEADAMVRHCPTPYGTHIRALGWPIVLVLNAYDATGDKMYLDAATQCWQVLKKNIDWKRGWVVRLAKDHCMHPQRTCYGNVPFMEGLTISALARYHRVTHDPEVLRAITVGIDQMIRECWVEEDKAFRYTACPLSTRRVYAGVCLAAEGMAYEARLTGNAEHLRILREGLREMMRKTCPSDGKSLAQLIHFTPYALAALDSN